MKMVIVMVILVLVVMMAIFTLALAKAAAVKSPMEQMLEDAEQRRYIDAWMRQQKLGSGCIDNTSEGIIGQNVESANTDGKKQKRRGLSADLMARWSCAWEKWRRLKRKP